MRLLDNDMDTLKINTPGSYTISVISRNAKGMVVFHLDRPETTDDPRVIELPSGKPARVPVAPYLGMPRAVKLDGGDGEVFVMHNLCIGDTLTMGKALEQGRAWVEVGGTVPATQENCKVYSESVGMQVTPHPFWGLPGLGWSKDPRVGVGVIEHKKTARSQAEA